MERLHSDTNHEHSGILRKSSSTDSGGARRKECGTPKKQAGSKDESVANSETDGCASDTGESPKRRVRVKVDFDTERNKSKRHYNLKKLAEMNRTRKKLQPRDMKTVKSCEDFRHREKNSSPNKSCENLKGGYIMRSHRPKRDVTDEINGYANKSCENLTLLTPDAGNALNRRSYHKSYEDLLTGKGLKPEHAQEGEKHHHHHHHHHHNHGKNGQALTASPAKSLPDRLRQTSVDKNAQTADKAKVKKEPKYIMHHTIKIEKWNAGLDGVCTTENMQKKFRMQAYSCGQHIVIPGKGLPDHNTGEIRRIGLVDGSLIAELYGKRIRLHPGDIIELPAGQRNCGDAEGGVSAVIVLGTKQGCLIS